MTQTDLFILGFLLGGCCIYFLYKKRRGIIIRRRLKKARKSEIAAIRFLEDRGYTITGMQEKKTIVTWVDKTPHYNNLRVDFIAHKKGKVYIAEVKTGQTAPHPTLADTRRQLLEYYLAYQPDGILLVDMEKQALREIAFSVYGENKRDYLYMLIIAAGIGFACGYLLYKYVDGGVF